MSNRIKISQLENLCSYLNRLTDSPLTYCDSLNGQPFKSNIGHYHLSQAYGGVMLARIANEGGAIDAPLGSYHRPKRELFYDLHAFIKGIESTLVSNLPNEEDE